MNGIRIFILLVLGLLCCSLPAGSATKQAFIKKEQWSKYSGKYDYTERYKTAQHKPKPVQTNFFSAPWLKFLLWAVIIALILVALVYLIISINRNSGNKVIREKIKSAAIIENIEETDLEYLLEQALANGMYKEAVRFRYLILIRSLNRLKLIAWKKDKTNGMYMREMYNKPGFDIFRELTVHFERVWYGELAISEKQYHALMPTYNQINELIEPEISQTSKLQ
jgi:hypothetical protein